MYIKLVIVVGGLHAGLFLAQAPAFSNIAKDDEVMVKYANTDEYRCRVLNAIDINTDSDTFKFFMKMSNNKILPKVMSRVSYYPMEYDDNTEDADMVE